MMKRNARNAFNALKKIGAPVLGPELGWGGHFAISGERAGRDDYMYPGSKDFASDGMDWAEYYSEDYAEAWSRFGVHNEINDILDDYDLFAEWVNPGVLAVYDA
jgi:hypothetical protein